VHHLASPGCLQVKVMEAPMDKYSADAVRESLLSASISHPNVVVRQQSTRQTPESKACRAFLQTSVTPVSGWIVPSHALHRV
jgi:hypothetical protein